MTAARAEEPMNTSCVYHMTHALIKNLRQKFTALIQGNCGFWDFKGTFYLKCLRIYASKYLIFTYLLRVLKDMQKKNLSFSVLIDFFKFSFPHLHKVFVFKQDNLFYKLQIHNSINHIPNKSVATGERF